MACDPQSLVTAASCFNCQPVAIQIAILIRLACAIRDGETTLACDPQSLINDANCILQCVPQGMTLAALIPVFCDIATNGGGGGGESCILCGVVDPVAAPGTCTCAAYYRTDVGSWFYWDNSTLTWVQLVGG